MQKLKDKVQSLANELEGAMEQINSLKSEGAELEATNVKLFEVNANLRKGTVP